MALQRTRTSRFRQGRSVRFGFGVIFSVVAVLGCRAARVTAPSSTPSPALATRAAPASDTVLPHQTFTIDSRVLRETRRINLYTPPGYDKAADARYPVLYMPDGGVEEDFPHVTSDVDAAIRAGEMRPVIVVGIENTERRRDMTGPTEVETDKKIAPRVGGSAAFRAFILDELMPAIGQRVRGNGQTAIVGESLAGLFVVETFFQEPRLFDVYIAFSPSLWWNAQALVAGAPARLRAQPQLVRTLYLASAGDDDRGDAVKTLAEALRATAPQGLTWYYEPRSDQNHSTIYRAASPGVFRKLFPSAPKSTPRWRWRGLADLTFSRAARFACSARR
jgi:predicted alpha/beta superfamily hydrolase